MRLLKSAFQLLAVVVLVGGAVLAMTSVNAPALTGPNETARLPGSGILDGMTFTSHVMPEGKSPGVKDVMYFKDGQFLSLECEDRCNYPASAYFARELDGGYEFMVEAWCPTKNATMVWRGQIVDGQASGTVQWTVKRFYWTVGTVLEFTGTLSTEEEAATWRG